MLITHAWLVVEKRTHRRNEVRNQGSSGQAYRTGRAHYAARTSIKVLGFRIVVAFSRRWRNREHIQQISRKVRQRLLNDRGTRQKPDRVASPDEREKGTTNAICTCDAAVRSNQQPARFIGYSTYKSKLRDQGSSNNEPRAAKSWPGPGSVFLFTLASVRGGHVKPRQHLWNLFEGENVLNDVFLQLANAFDSSIFSITLFF